MLICFGTRPEYIKVKSLIDNIKDVKTCFTGQHHDLLKDIHCDYRMDFFNKTDNKLNNILINNLSDYQFFKNIKFVLVQGDTTSAFGMALNAFHNNIKVIHLEAGLRTNDKLDPYPEELNRQLISKIADYHLCPTKKNMENLHKENIYKNVYITGNTGLDNISKDDCYYGNKILITIHRRNNIDIIDKWFYEINKIASTNTDLEFILPMHPNPEIQKHKAILKNVNVIEPLNHSNLITILKTVKFVISDSGGIQEEASFLNKKIIICRKTSERDEIIGKHGIFCKCPSELNDIFNVINENYYINEECPFGDGNAYKKIINIFNNL